MNLYYLNLAPSPYLDSEAAIQNDKPLVVDDDDNKPTYDPYGGYDCVPSYLYYGQGGSGGLFQHFQQNHQHIPSNQHNHNSNHHQSSHTSTSHHTSNGQINYDDVNAESGGSSGNRPTYSDSNRPSGGPFGFFGSFYFYCYSPQVKVTSAQTKYIKHVR